MTFVSCAVAASSFIGAPILSKTVTVQKPGFRSSRLAIRADGAINPSIQKDVEKVASFVNVSTDLSKPSTPYCRCWRSETFPLCNGSHMKHNKETGDNVGPLILKK